MLTRLKRTPSQRSMASLLSTTTSSSSPLDRLRHELRARGLLGYIVPSEDAHQSEYVRECDKRRAFLSGFDGSAGTAAATINNAGVWTDGRYYLQAEKQLSAQWSLMKTGEKSTPSVAAWLAKEVSAAAGVAVDGSLGSIGFDPRLASITTVEGWKSTLDASGVSLVEDADGCNLVDIVWGDEKPPPQHVPVKPLGLEFSGQEAAEKLGQLREEMRKKQVQVAVVSALDEVAWLLNLRGADIEYNPLFMSFVVVTDSGDTTLCANPSQLASKATQMHLDKAGVRVQPYESVGDVLRKIKFGNATEGKEDKDFLRERKRLKTDQKNDAKVRVWLDPATCNWDVFRTVQRLGMVPVRDAPLSIQLAKSLKNTTELDGMRASHVRDGAALCSHFAWLEAQLLASDGDDSLPVLDEVTVADHLEARRAQEEHFVGLSFETISSSGPNGAIIHYAPTKGACRVVSTNELYLCDSGGQYLDGTTDITRTIHFGTPTAHERRCFTRVLQGHIALASARFPVGTEGHKLDILARLPLFSDGLDYGHGTGHGVGAYGCVHEGPQGIGMRRRRYEGGLQPSMTMTIEPGYYEDGKFGIRIENVYIVVAKETPHRYGDQAFLGFENITWAPIQTKMIVAELLSPKELAWLNKYNSRCREVLLPQLEDEPETAAWVVRETEPLAVPKL